MSRSPLWVVVGLSFLFLLSGAHAATIQGTIYDGLTLDVLSNVVVSVNTNPTQTKLVKDGLYSFELPPGTYTLKATYTEQGILLLDTVQGLTIEKDGNYTLDLILLPTVGDVPDEPLPDEDDSIWSQIGSNVIPWLIILAIVLGAIGYFVMQGRKHTHGKELNVKGLESIPHAEEIMRTPMITDEITLDQYAREMMGHLKRGGNRLTQKELREMVNIGGAKVSLVVSELESYGLIKKIKRGRGNILILTEKGRAYMDEKGIGNETPNGNLVSPPKTHSEESNDENKDDRTN